MSRIVVNLLATLLAAAALAGCTGGEDTPPTTTPPTSTPVTTTPDTTTTTTTPPTEPTTQTPPTQPTQAPPGGISADSFAVEAVGVPSIVEEDKPFSFTVFVNGSASISSDHIGAHFGPTSTTQPSLDVYTSGCAHTSGTLPGEFTVNCTLETAGSWYLRGHARATSENVTHHYWGAEKTIRAVNVSLNSTGVPTAVAGNQTFTFKLNVTSNQSITSDHIGAHWGWAPTTAPSTTTYPNACVHQSGELPGEFTVTCEMPSGGLTPTKAFLRGHVRVTEGSTQVNFWTSEYEITVGGGLPI